MHDCRDHIYLVKRKAHEFWNLQTIGYHTLCRYKYTFHIITLLKMNVFHHKCSRTAARPDDWPVKRRLRSTGPTQGWSHGSQVNQRMQKQALTAGPSTSSKLSAKGNTNDSFTWTTRDWWSTQSKYNTKTGTCPTCWLMYHRPKPFNIWPS